MSERTPALQSGSFRHPLSFQFAQIAEATDREAAGILHALCGQAADVPRQIAPHALVQIVSDHAAIDLHRSGERPGDFNLRHA